MRNKHIFAIAVTLLLIAAVAHLLTHQQRTAMVHPPASGSQNVYTPQPQAKTSGCVAVNNLPDLTCTPGAVIASATKDQICVSGYSRTVRHVPVAEKDAVYAEYGIPSHVPGEYEVDHLISLELGGSNDIANLWPEAANPTPGFHQKDAFENELHAKVCAGTISLAEAQKEIASNWLQYYNAR